MSTFSPLSRPATRQERETVIRYNDADPDAVLWTASLKTVRQWAKLGLAIIADSGGWRASAPKAQVQIRRAYTLSPEKLEAARTRLAGARQKKAARHVQAPTLTNLNDSVVEAL